MTSINRSRSAPAQRPSALMLAAIVSFVAGLAAVIVIFSLHMAGRADLPWWLNLTAIALTSTGFLLGLLALLREARR